jgi:uncharacterized membrane protein
MSLIAMPNKSPEPTGSGRPVLSAGVSVFFISLVAGGSAFYVRLDTKSDAQPEKRQTHGAFVLP